LATWQSYRDTFTAAALAAGRPQEFIAHALTYAQHLWNSELPIIFDEEHLAALVGFEFTALREALTRPRSLYQTSYIPKHSGGYRRIDALIESLKKCQLWVLRNILQRIPVHLSANAFIVGRSIRDNALMHTGQPIVISLDVKDFFSSLSATKCEKLFIDLGYDTGVAQMLRQITTFESALPQGAPSSPALSNLLMRKFDAAMLKETIDRGIRYTRYADDITVSGLCRPGSIIELCTSLLAQEGLFLNKNKTRVMLTYQRQEVTGIVVNTRMQAPRTLRRYLRHHTHMIRTHGVPRDVARDPQSVQRYQLHLRGVAEFILFINPDDRDAKDTISLLGRVRFR